LQDYLEEVIQKLRRTIKAQRPPLLNEGLPLALESLVGDMQKLAGNTPQITWHCNLNGETSLNDEQATSLDAGRARPGSKPFWPGVDAGARCDDRRAAHPGVAG
jgi:hypothetical protein